MSKRNSKSQDEISQLLDSFEVEDTLEEKMDSFKQEKERQSRLNRARNNSDKFRQRYDEEVDLTQIMSPIDEPIRLGADDLENDVDDSSQTRTMMWDKQELDEEVQDTNKTVVINDDEIQSLLEEEKGPKLRREVHKAKPKSKKSGPDSKTIMIVVAGVIGVLLTCAVIFGVIKLVSDGFGDDTVTEQQQKENYEEILEWANGYDFLSDSEKEEIIDFESKFNKLSDEQQDEINKVLKVKTGKTFDELLAQAKSDAKDKTDAKNNNTKIAEQKAKLREQISSKKKELSSAQSDLDSANSKLTSAKSKLDSANQSVSTAQSQVDTINARITELDASNANLQVEKDTYYRQYLDLPYDDPQRESLWQQIEEINAQMKTNNTDIATAKNELPTAQQALSTAQSEQTTAQSEYDSAQTAVNDAQSKYDSINSEIQELQSELDALDTEN